MANVGLMILLLLLLPGQSHADVWKNKHQWTSEQDKRYVKWVRKNWTPDIFMDKHRPAYYRIATDCADATYFMRLIFAWENKLPFVIHHPYKRGKRLSNSTRAFDKIPAGIPRLRAFMEYVSTQVSSKSLPNDTYPIALKAIRPGDVYVSPGNHSFQIIDISETGIPTVLNSSTPKAPRYLNLQHTFPLFVPTDTKSWRDGYRRFRNPDDLDKPMNQLPDFSTEQYRIAKAAGYSYVRFSNILAYTLGSRRETVSEKARRLFNDLCALTRKRREYVDEGVDYLRILHKKKHRRCMNRHEYDQYSTFHRDQRLAALFNQVKRQSLQMVNHGEHNHALKLLRAIFRPETIDSALLAELDQRCPIRIDDQDGPILNLRSVWQVIQAGRLESDPHATRQQRWGIAEKPYTPHCPVYEDR